MNISATVGFVLFPGLTQLDLTGPFEVLARVPGVDALLVAHDRSPVASDAGLHLVPTNTFAERPHLAVGCVPGGPGLNAAMLDAELVTLVREQAKKARFVTSVCSGALILG